MEGSFDDVSLRLSVVVNTSEDSFSFFRVPPWVETTNNFFEKRGYRISVSAFGKNELSYHKKGFEQRIYRKLSFFKDPISFPLYFHMLKDNANLAIVHGLPDLTTLIALIIYGIKRIPVIIFVHGVHREIDILDHLRNLLIRVFLRIFPARLVVLTKYDKKVLLEKWKLSEANIVLSNACLLLTEKEREKIHFWKRYVKEKEKRKGEKQFTVLYVGRLSWEKRVDRAIQAFKRIQDKMISPNIKLVIVGDGPQKKLLISLARKYNVEKYIEFKGAVSNEEVWKYYLMSDVLILPSEQEGFPRVIIEAFACGKPVLASNICGIPEIVIHNTNGMLINNHEEIADCIIKLSSDPDTLKKLAENAEKTYKSLMSARAKSDEPFGEIVDTIKCLCINKKSEVLRESSELMAFYDNGKFQLFYAREGTFQE